MTPKAIWKELNVAQVAKRLGKSRMGVNNWKHQKYGIPAEVCLDIEREFGIDRSRLRPDLWGHACTEAVE